MAGAHDESAGSDGESADDEQRVRGRMSTRLTPALKALCALRGDAVSCSSPQLAALSTVVRSAHKHASQWPKVPPRRVDVLCAATLFTLNAPGALVHLFETRASESKSTQDTVELAARLREVGVKCISFIGIAKIINELGVLTGAYPDEIKAALWTEPTRSVTSATLSGVRSSGAELWTSIYAPHDVKLTNKLASYHPDLPVHIHESHYGPLLSNFEPRSDGHAGQPRQGEVDRVDTSLVAIACLRAQKGVGPQVVSHVLGLRKAGVEHAGHLATDEGSEWTLRLVDQIMDVVESQDPGAKL